MLGFSVYFPASHGKRCASFMCVISLSHAIHGMILYNPVHRDDSVASMCVCVCIFLYICVCVYTIRVGILDGFVFSLFLGRF